MVSESVDTELSVLRFQKIFGLYSVEHHQVEKWSGQVGQWIVGVMSFQKMYGLHVKHHVVEIREGRLYQNG